MMAEPRLRADSAVQRAVGDPVWLVISVGCLCLVMLAKANLLRPGPWRPGCCRLSLVR